MSASLTTLSPANQGVHRDADAQYEQYGVNPYLLPYDGTHIDPIHALTVLRSGFTDLPKTAKTLRIGTIESEFDTPENSTLSRRLSLLSEFLGSWNIGTDYGNRTQFINPNYIHMDHLPEEELITDDKTRVRVLKRAAEYGTLDQEYLANRFGITQDKVSDIIARNNLNWQERRQNGLKRLSHTVLTLTEWGYTKAEIGDALDCSRDWLAAIIADHADDSFEPPARRLP